MQRNSSITKKYLLFPVAIVFGLVLQVGLVAGAVSRGYSTDDTELRPGMAVILSHDSTADSPKVERATQETSDKVIGITTDAEDNAATIASNQQAIYVETTGEVDAFVSDVNGKVHRGDRLAVSSLKGILGKAQTANFVMGTALEEFETKPTESYSIQTSEGSKTVGVVTMRINIDYKGSGSSSVASDQPDSSLAHLGQALTGKDVGEIRVVISLIIFLIVLVVEGSILYGAISSSLTALGRNPMAGKFIRGELLRVIIVAILVLTIGLGSVYLILNL